MAPTEPSPPNPQLMHYLIEAGKVGFSSSVISKEVWVTSSLIPIVNLCLGFSIYMLLNTEAIMLGVKFLEANP